MDNNGEPASNNNGEPAANNNSSVPASIWTQEKWFQKFSDLQKFAIRVIYLSAWILLVGLLVAKHYHPSPSCLVGSDQPDEMFAKGSVSMMFLIVAAVVLNMKQRIRGLSALQLARLRSKLEWILHVRYCCRSRSHIYGFYYAGRCSDPFWRVEMSCTIYHCFYGSVCLLHSGCRYLLTCFYLLYVICAL
ncbi:uncharacterized protein LOC113273930 [Papaver somniferum]|uniref:uncharacterized protein LOC113273930 n=1 Tax=Papaver somniferum TaxID=3469 RepID=UPI000E70363F|nr:uncharacterized protein LOC113273930 [Papaver somniferum]XP_026379282.1 uncharacterized protein LOC113273930 [Papaver somniferum]